MDAARKEKIARYLMPVVAILFIVTIVSVYHLRNEGRLMNARLLEKADSYYNTIFIYEGKDGQRHMVFGYHNRKYFESVHNPADPLELQLGYTRLMTVSLLYDPAPQNILSIGMGGGKVSGYMLAMLPQPHITEVELDPDVVKLAKKYFDYQDTPRRTVVVNDGRKFLLDTPGQYDLIMLDAYRGPFVPFHLLTQEFYREVKKHLAPGGVVAQNIDSGTLLFDSTMATLKQAFAQTEYYEVEGNIVAIAYDGPRKSEDELARRAGELDARYHLRYPLAPMLQGRTFVTLKPDVKPLTDDFAPVDTLNAIATHNRKWE